MKTRDRQLAVLASCDRHPPTPNPFAAVEFASDLRPIIVTEHYDVLALLPAVTVIRWHS